MSRTTPSPAMKLVALVWNHAQEVYGHSYDRLNFTMREVVKLAIYSGMRFVRHDFRSFDDQFRMGYWGDLENFYTLAVTVGNLSAAQAIENYLSRKPFIFHAVTPVRHHCVARAWTRAKGRLTVGSQFRWRGEDVTVTSFTETSITSLGAHVVACSYKPNTGENVYQRKIARRFRITRKDLLAERRGAPIAKPR